MKWIKRIAIGFLFTYLLIFAAAFFVQRSFLYFPPNIYVTPAAANVPEMEEVLFLTGSKAAISWWSPPQDGNKAVVMFFHGNGSAVFSNRDVFADLIAQGYGVLSVSYPGYPQIDMDKPESVGKPNQDAITATALQNYEFLSQKNIIPNRIVYFGTSLGSGVASQLAAIHQPRLLIVDAPFNSALDMGKKRMPFLPVGLLMKDKFQSDKALVGLNVPLIWIHGTADRIIPMSQGQKLFDNYNGPKTAHIIEGGHHINLWGNGGREIVLDALENISP